MGPFHRRSNERLQGRSEFLHSFPNNRERVDRFSSPGNSHRTINGWRNTPEYHGTMRDNAKSTGRRTQNGHFSNPCSDNRQRDSQFYHTGNSSATSNNRRRKIDHTNNNTVTNRQGISFKKKTNWDIHDSEVPSKKPRFSLPSNNNVVDSSNIPEEGSSIPDKTSKTGKENQIKGQIKNKNDEKYKIPKKCDVVPSISKSTEANQVDDTTKNLKKNVKKVSNQNDTSLLKTNPNKQFKILLCEISSKIKEGWQLDVSGLSIENLRNGEINFTKEEGQKKMYSFYDIKYISTNTTGSKDAKLNYATFSRSLVKNYFQRYLKFDNNRPSDYLKEFEVRCNIKLNTGCFDKQGIDVVPLGSSTYKLEIQEPYKKNVEKLGLYDHFLSCCTLPNLADKIANYMSKKKAHFNDVILQKYFLTFIAEKIFEKKEEKDKYIMKFHQDFIKENDLSESAKELRRLLSKRMQLTDEMEFTVNNVTFKKQEKGPVEPLPIERFDMFQNFLEIFKFRTVDNDIDAIVKNTIGDKFIAIDDDWYLNAVQVGLRKAQGLGVLNSQLFQFLEREIHKCNVIKKMQEESCFHQENIQFENIGLQRIYQYLKEENRKAVFCSTKHMTITEHKLRQLSNEKFGYSENQESLFINDKVLFEFTEDVKQGFLSYSLKLLVVLLQEKSTASCAQLLNILNNLISKSFLHKDKSIIVVLSTRYETLLGRKYRNIPVEVDESLSPLMLESLNQLKQSNVVLHGHEMKIAELMDDASIAELIQLPEILEQFLDEELVLKDIIMKPNGFDLKCYETKLRDESNKICEIIDILKCKSQVSIISGESGIGKSVCLYELAQKTCNEYVSALECGLHFWLIQINIDKLPFEKLTSQDSMDILELLARYLGLNHVQKKAFIMSIEGRLKLKLIFVIDGYDEVHLVYKDFALKILHQLENSSIQKMFVASRDNTIFESVSGRYIVEFSGENKKQYCRKYFRNSAVCIDSLAKELTNTPLHLKMLQKINRDPKQVVSVKDSLDLYKKYTELKINKEQIVTFLEPSAQRVLSTEDLKLLNFEFQEENLNFRYPEELQHVAFYEYFTAWWLSAKFMGEADVRCKISNIVDRLVGKTSPVFFSTFIAPLNLNELVDELAEYGCLDFLKALLTFKDIQRPGLHRIVKNNDTNACEVLRYLFEHYKPTNDYPLIKYVNQQINNETPIQLSCRLQKMDVACELMLVGADVRCLEQNFLVNMTIHVIRKLIRRKSRFENIAEKLLELSSEALTHINQKLEYPRLMKYFLERGRKTVIEGLMAKEPNRKKLLTMRVDGKSPLDLVSNSQWLDNEQRLEMYKYIIENAGDELQRESKSFIQPVLRRACETDSENIFNYFVDQLPGSVNEFLNAALRDDRLSDVEFVVKISERKRTIDEEGNTLLHRAVKYGTSDEIIDFLIDRDGVAEVNGNQETHLHVAFKTGLKFPRIKYLIERRASLLATDRYGLYPWCYALLDRYRPYDKNEQIELMDYLVNCKSIEPPANATFGFKSDAYKREVTKKMDYFRDPRNYMRKFNANSGLLSSLLSEEEYFCRFMIVHGADVNARGTDGKTALHVALECKLYELAKLMLQHGAAFDVEDRNNTTPLGQLANNFDGSCRESKRMKEILELAREIFADEKSLKRYSSVSPEKLKQSRIRHIVNCRDRRGRGLFHVAALAGDEAVVRDVAELSKNCCATLTDFPQLNINDRDVEGRTPLELAVFRKLNRVVDELRSLGARGVDS